MALSLNDIKSGVRVGPPRLVVHGPKGIGKTSFAAEAPNPIILPTEDGLGVLDTPAFPLMKSYAEVEQAIGALVKDDHNFQTAIVDSFDWLEPLIWAETCKRHEESSIESFGYGKGYIFAADVWREFFDGLNALREKRGMAIMLLGHTATKRYEPPDTEPYDRYMLKLHQRASDLLVEWADGVLFVDYKKYIVKDDAGFNQKNNRGISDGTRVLYTEERPSHIAKNRYNLPYELPFNKGSAWAGFEAAMAEGISKAKKTVSA